MIFNAAVAVATPAAAVVPVTAGPTNATLCASTLVSLANAGLYERTDANAVSVGAVVVLGAVAGGVGGVSGAGAAGAMVGGGASARCSFGGPAGAEGARGAGRPGAP